MKHSTLAASLVGIVVSLLVVGMFTSPSNAAPRLQAATATPVVGTTATSVTAPTALATATVTSTTSLTPTPRGPSTLPTTGDDDFGGPVLLFGLLGSALLVITLFARLYARNSAQR